MSRLSDWLDGKIDLCSNSDEISVSATSNENQILDFGTVKLIEDKRFYVYIYFDPRKIGKYQYQNLEFDFEPFYVGFGKDNRYLTHLRESFTRKVKKLYHKHYKIRKIKEVTGNDPIIIKYKENLTFDQGLELEKELIKIIGRLDLKTGPLLNMTDGGEGILGYWNIEENIEKHKERMSEKHNTNKWKTEHSERMKKWSNILENKEKLVKKFTDYYENNLNARKETNKKLKEARNRPENKKANSERVKKYYNDHPEALIKQSEQRKGKINIYNKELDILKHINKNDPIPEGFIRGGRPQSEEQRKRQSERMKGKCVGKDNPNYGNKWNDEQRKRMSQQRKGKKKKKNE